MSFLSVRPAASAYELRVGNHSVAVDRASDQRGRGSGPTPVELFVGAVAACAADAAAAFLDQHRRPADLLEVGCHYEIAGGRVASIQLSLRLADGLEPELQAGLLHAVHGCGLNATLLVPLHLSVSAVSTV